MNGVMGRPQLHRQDIILSRSADQSVGFRWYKTDGTTKTLVDLTYAIATVRFESLTGEVWSEFDARIYDDSLISIETDSVFFSGPEWASRTTGAWSVHVELFSKITQVAGGYLYLS